MDQIKKGNTHIYTGNGKGKTTSALGRVLRATGQGRTTLFIMFMKDYPYGEIRSLARLNDLVTLEQYGNDTFVFNKQPPDKTDLEAARRALARAREAFHSARYDIVVLDEICVAIYFTLLKTRDVLDLLKEKPDSVELILTGRYCPSELIEKADSVTEMREIRHYYQKGVISRKGIES